MLLKFDSNFFTGVTDTKKFGHVGFTSLATLAASTLYHSAATAAALPRDGRQPCEILSCLCAFMSER